MIGSKKTPGSANFVPLPEQNPEYAPGPAFQEGGVNIKQKWWIFNWKKKKFKKSVFKI